MYPNVGYSGIALINKVVLTKKSLKDLGKVPSFISDKLQLWIQSVEKIGLEEVRKIAGFHDEPLQGKWKGHRSIRLNRSYRAIYQIKGNKIKFVEINEVNKHEY